MLKHGVKLATILSFLAMLALSENPSSGATSPSELRVPGDCETIQACIDKAQAGDTILIAEGNYTENLVIEKSLALRGVGRDKVRIQSAAAGEPVIQMTGDEPIEVVIQGLIISDAKPVSFSQHCVDRSAGICPYGISVRGRVRVMIRDSAVSSNQDDGLWVGDSAQVNLTNSTVSDNERHGLYVRDSAQVSLTNSTVSGNELPGIFVWDLAQISLSNSTVSDNMYAVFVWDSAQANITDSTISGNEVHGLVAYISAQMKVRGSTIEGNGTEEECRALPFRICNGIAVSGEARVTVRAGGCVSAVRSAE